MAETFEVNFDGLVGNTHNYAGLSFGNIASQNYGGSVAHPRQAALQGLDKMYAMMKLGIKQAVLPPQERPHVPTLRSLGYRGGEHEIIAKVGKEHSLLLTMVTSASCMWTANAATVAPSVDTADGRVHITPANLIHKFHRSIESTVMHRTLQAIFPDPERFTVHPPLKSSDFLGDEGAANHTRFCSNYGERGVHLFVYGKRAFGSVSEGPKHYPARQTREASEAVARSHGLSEDQVVFAQQNPAAIDEGVFHNDVISVGNGLVFFYHEQAFLDNAAVLKELRKKVWTVCGQDLIEVVVPKDSVSIQEAVHTYLFNSQIVTLPNGNMALIAPLECEESPRVSDVIQRLLSDKNNPIESVHYLDVRESMQNGGGPACLRQRILLNTDGLKLCNPGVFLTEALYKKLQTWIYRHYRTDLAPPDLQDPHLIDETWSALNELTEILNLGPIYDFQRVHIE